ncbi:MAG: hypothetical protein AAF267_13095, partial [Deinococcota bacterium]
DDTTLTEIHAYFDAQNNPLTFDQDPTHGSTYSVIDCWFRPYNDQKNVYTPDSYAAYTWDVVKDMFVNSGDVAYFSAPYDGLFDFMFDWSPNIPRVLAAAHWTASQDIADMEALARDRDVYVRRAAAANPELPKHLVEMLVGDVDHGKSHFKERMRIYNTVGRALQVVHKVSYEVLDAVDADIARIKTTDQAQELRDAANHSWSRIRAATARNPNTPRDVLEKLLEDTIP